MKTIIKIFLFLFFFAQLSAQDTNTFREINEQVWVKFEKAFATVDAELLISLHTSDVLRIPAESKVVVVGSEYFETQKMSFKWIKDNKYSMDFQVRFTERINNGEVASERGVYHYKLTDEEGEVRIFTGNFHVLLRKENSGWKITMNYDTSESGQVLVADFDAAIDKWNYKPFLIIE